MKGGHPVGYQRPVPYSRSTSWATHRRRNPPSSEPGIDMFCPIGTPVLAAESGRIVDTGDSIRPATGRFVTIDLDDGRRVRYLHLSSRSVSVGMRVRRAQVIGYSGATGYGEEDWSWNVAETGGAHVHMTVWPLHLYAFGLNGTLDPEQFFDPDGSAAFDNATPIPKEWDEMASKDEIKAAVREVVREVNRDDVPRGIYIWTEARGGALIDPTVGGVPLAGEEAEAALAIYGRGPDVNDRQWDVAVNLATRLAEKQAARVAAAMLAVKQEG